MESHGGGKLVPPRTVSKVKIGAELYAMKRKVDDNQRDPYAEQNDLFPYRFK